MTPYERAALARIRAWQAEPPGWGTRLLARPGSKLVEAVRVLIPTQAIAAALNGADTLGRKLSDERSILRRAGVADLASLRDLPLEHADRLAQSVARRASMLAAAGGAAFGIAGAAGLIADVPTLLTLALRTIHRVGLCYGDKPDADDRRRLGLTIFALVSANSTVEKAAALAALQSGAGPLDAAWRDGVERVAEREIAKEAAVLSLQNLSRAIGLNLGRRKVAGSIPVVGAAIGAAVNAGYLADVARAARYVFQQRWLERRHPGALKA